MGNSHDSIMRMIEPGSTVLDLGCGNGELLKRLRTEKNIVGCGIEIEEHRVDACIANGIQVFQGNLNHGLPDFADDSYDIVILSQTLQEVHHPDTLLREMLRVGERIIVNFPNFGHLLNRLQFVLLGRMPVNRNIPYQWYDTPNIHFCTRRDFIALSQTIDAEICHEIAITHGRQIPLWLSNCFATESIVMLHRGRHSGL